MQAFTCNILGVFGIGLVLGFVNVLCESCSRNFNYQILNAGSIWRKGKIREVL